MAKKKKPSMIGRIIVIQIGSCKELGRISRIFKKEKLVLAQALACHCGFCVKMPVKFFKSKKK